MPIVVVTHASGVEQEQLVRLLHVMPHAVSLAVQCPEEPYDGTFKPGDVEVRARPRGLPDIGGLDFVVEVRSKWFESRARDRQERCDRLCAMLVESIATSSIGVYLSLPTAAWSQGE